MMPRDELNAHLEPRFEDGLVPSRSIPPLPVAGGSSTPVPSAAGSGTRPPASLCPKTRLPCPLDGCGCNVAREDMAAHVFDPSHLLRLLLSMQAQNAELHAKSAKLHAKNAELHAKNTELQMRVERLERAAGPSR